MPVCAPARRCWRPSAAWRLPFIALAIISDGQGATTSFVQRHGLRATGYIQDVRHDACGTPYQSQTCIGASFTVRLVHPVDGVSRVSIAHPQYVPTPTNRPEPVRIDPHNPRYAELAGRPRSTTTIWMLGVILSAIVVGFTALDARSLLRAWRGHHQRGLRRDLRAGRHSSKTR